MGPSKKEYESIDTYFSEVANKVKFRYLGLGFLWAWIYATWFTPVVFPSSTGLTISNDTSWFVSSSVVAVTLFAVAAFLKDREVSEIPLVSKLAGPLTSIGAIMMASGALFGIDAPWLFLLGAALTGVASGFLWMLWGEFTGKVNQELAELFVPLCILVPLVTIFVCMYATGPIAGLAICLLPLVSGVLLMLSLNDQEALNPVKLMPEEDRPHYLRDFARVGIGSLALYACFGFVWGKMEYVTITGWGDTPLLPYEVGAILAVLVSVGAISYAKHLDLFALYRILVPVVLFGMVFLCVRTYWAHFASLMLITCAQYVFDVLIWIYFSRVTRRGVCTGSVAIGVNRGFVQAGVVLGNLLVIGVMRLQLTTVAPISFIVLVLSAVTMTVVLMVLSRSDELERIAVKEGVAATLPDAAVIDYDAVCELLTERYGLTARESEILGFLARGRSVPYIRDTLVLSKNTVGTHVKNLYRKLDIHTRQDLFDLVENPPE